MTASPPSTSPVVARYQRGRLPMQFPCPACAYDLTGSDTWICSECGHVIEAKDVMIWRRWTELQQFQRPGVVVSVLIGAIALFAFEGCLTFGIGPVVGLATWMLGVPAVYSLPPHRRRTAAFLWLDESLTLHVPVLAGALIGWMGAFAGGAIASFTEYAVPFPTNVVTRFLIALVLWVVAMLVLARVIQLCLTTWFESWRVAMGDSWWAKGDHRVFRVCQALAIGINVLGGLIGAGLSGVLVLLPQ